MHCAMRRIALMKGAIGVFSECVDDLLEDGSPVLGCDMLRRQCSDNESDDESKLGQVPEALGIRDNLR